MSDFTEFAREFLARMKIPARCSRCGNTNLEELAVARGRLICRQDVENIRQHCDSGPGWYLLDARGKVIDRGAGITFQPTSVMTE